MKNIRQLFSATVLTLVITGVVFAGDMWLPGGGSTPPPPPQGGRVASSPSKTEVTALDTLAVTTLLLCKRMLSIF